MPDTLAIDARGLVRHFGPVRAVDGIDLTVASGSVVGLLGPNGAGKTTVVRILATLIPPHGGEVRILGHDLVDEADAVRRRISLTGQFAAVDEDLTGRENLVVFARLFGYSRKAARTRAEELLEAFGLEDAAGRQVKRYSGGMHRRLDIAASMVVAPDLLFLDEPTTGLDPASRNQVWHIVRDLVDAGATVLLTTQYLDEADRLADRIAVIDHGRIMAEGTPGELKSSVGPRAVRVRLEDPSLRPEARRVLARTLEVPVEFAGDPLALSARVDDAGRIGPALTELTRGGIALSTLEFGQPRLDDVFLTLTGHPLGPSTDNPEEPA